MRPIPFMRLLNNKTNLGLEIAHEISIKIREGELIEITVESKEVAEEIVSESIELGVKARIKRE